MPNDMAQTIVPKSDQLNADDLIAGPITIKITGVTIRGGQEQPIAISYEGDGGKPYKACKSMCRVMVTAWGADSKKYTGRSMTLYRDPQVKWGGMEVGGIRISHMSDIPESLTMALTVTRANKRPFTVKPIPSSATQAANAGGASKPPAEPASAGPSAEDIIRVIENAKDGEALSLAADSARIAFKDEDQAIKDRARDAYKKRLAELRGVPA